MLMSRWIQEQTNNNKRKKKTVVYVWTRPNDHIVYVASSWVELSSMRGSFVQREMSES